MGTPCLRRVAIFHPNSFFDSMPSLTSAVTMLARHGYGVDIFLNFGKLHSIPRFADERISLFPLRNALRDHSSGLRRFIPDGIYWPALWQWRHRQAPYVCLIGVDPDGLSKAFEMSRWINAPVVYYSLHLVLSYEITTEEGRAVKAREMELSRRATWVITQDSDRAGLLIRDNDLSPERVIYVPNAPLGAAELHRSDYLRRRFNIPATTRIMLHAGSLMDWSGVSQMACSTHSWPDDWVLVCHSQRRSDEKRSKEFTVLERLAKPGRVIFSTDPLPHQEYPELVRSADVCLVYYMPILGSIASQDNIRCLGRASGKLAHALQAGKPVVANQNPSIERLLTTYACGEITVDPVRNRSSLERVFENYDRYSRNAAACFDAEYNFAKGFEPLLAWLDSL